MKMFSGTWSVSMCRFGHLLFCVYVRASVRVCVQRVRECGCVCVCYLRFRHKSGEGLVPERQAEGTGNHGHTPWTLVG